MKVNLKTRWTAAACPVPIRRYLFKSGFIWGTSTSAGQIEGAQAPEYGRGQCIWQTYFEQRLHLDHGETACDHYNRMESDVRLMKRLGMKAYRFSISWSRVMPNGFGDVNEQGVLFYVELVKTLRRYGIEPFVTLYHWDLPQALEDQGGWLSRETANLFAEFAALMATRLGEYVRFWGTLNEPEVIVAGYIGDGLAPGYSRPRTRVHAVHNLMLAHGLAVRVLRAINPDFKIGVTVNLVPAEAADPDSRESLNKARIHWLKNYGLYLEALLKGRYPEVVLDEARATGVRVKPGDMEIICQPIDYLGVNWYLRHVVDSVGSVLEMPGAIKTLMGWETQPQALTRMLIALNDEYEGILPPIYITENGAAFKDKLVGMRVHDFQRMTYIHEHLSALESAAAAGVDIAGYFAWSFMDNLEWSLGYKMTFGLVHVVRKTLRRIIKDSGYWFAAVIKANQE